MDTINFSCKLCDNSRDNISYTAQEMMYGTKEKFEYIKCSKCGCLQIKIIPGDLGKYYPDTYYSFKNYEVKSRNHLKTFIRHQIAKCYLHKRSFFGCFFSKYLKRLPEEYFNWINALNLTFDARILDVGAGSGDLLFSMHEYGFKNVIGIDPNISNQINNSNGVVIYKTNLTQMKENISSQIQLFDLIMFNHSFEHMPDPTDVLKNARALLEPKGLMLIRVPVCDTFAWKEYGVDWVQFDAPRHLFLHTTKSITLLAKKFGFKLIRTDYDSNEFQFWGSEQYKKGISLNETQSYLINPSTSKFSKNKIDNYREKAVKLNKNNDGDQACFYFQLL
jgi:2-polyprenyl-3-methyl-5-hydroxy-6-metoxy-1,4-benzoquinol methylase